MSTLYIQEVPPRSVTENGSQKRESQDRERYDLKITSTVRIWVGAEEEPLHNLILNSLALISANLVEATLNWYGTYFWESLNPEKSLCKREGANVQGSPIQAKWFSAPSAVGERVPAGRGSGWEEGKRTWRPAATQQGPSSWEHGDVELRVSQFWILERLFRHIVCFLLRWGMHSVRVTFYKLLNKAVYVSLLPDC